MKENDLKTSPGLDDKLRERLLLGRRVEGDRLMLPDAVLCAALDGSRPLTAPPGVPDQPVAGRPAAGDPARTGSLTTTLAPTWQTASSATWKP